MICIVQQFKYYSYAGYEIPISIPKLYSTVYMTSWFEWLINISNTTSHIKTEFLTLSPKPALPTDIPGAGSCVCLDNTLFLISISQIPSIIMFTKYTQ